MKDERNNVQLRKGVIEMCVLQMTLRGAKYTGDILKELKETELIVVEGTLYPLLNRLKDDGFLEYYWEESTGGPPRKYFKITEKGMNYLSILKNNWSKLLKSVNEILN